MPKKGESGKAKEGTKELKEGIKCYSRYNNAGFVYSICGPPYEKGKAKVKAPPRGEFSAYYRGEDTHGPLEAYYMAPTIDASDWLVQQGVKFSELSPAQQNEYHRLDMAKRRSERFSALSSAMETGGGEAFIEYLKSEKEKKKVESELEVLQKEAKKKQKALEVKYKTKGVVATSPEEVKEYYQNVADKNIKQLLDEDSIQQEITNRVEGREIELDEQIKEGKNNIVAVVKERDLWLRPFKSYPKIERDFLEESGLKGNPLVRASIYRSKGKLPSWITQMRKVANTRKKNRIKEELLELVNQYKDGDVPKKKFNDLKLKLLQDEDNKILREIVGPLIANNTPFVPEEELAEGQKEEYNKLIKGAGEVFASDTKEEFSKNYLKFMTENVRKTREVLVKNEKTGVDKNVARAKIQLKKIKQEARDRGKTGKWIDKYTKLIITSEQDLKDIEEAEAQGHQISSITLGQFEDYFKSAGTLIDDVEKIEKEIKKLDKKKEKNVKDYEKKSKHLKDKKTLVRLLKDKKEGEKKINADKIIQEKKEAKLQKKLDFQLKQQGKVSTKISKEIKEKDETEQDISGIDKYLKQVEKEIEEHKATNKETGEISMEFLEKQPPTIPPTIKGKKATKRQIKRAKREAKKNKAGYSFNDAKEGTIQKHQLDIIVGKEGKQKQKKVDMASENDVHIAIEQVFPDFDGQEIDEFIVANSLKNEMGFVEKIGLDTELEGVERKSEEGAGVGWKSWLRIKKKLKEEKGKK